MKGGDFLVDARFNANARMKVLGDAVTELRNRYGEDLVMVVVNGGMFGFRGQLPVDMSGDLVDTTVGRVLSWHRARRSAVRDGQSPAE